MPAGIPPVVAGAGPVGGLVALLLDHLGFAPLAIIERNSARAQLVAAVSGARRLDADAAGLGAFTGPRGLRLAVEATGSQAMLDFLVGSLAGRGRLALVGLYTGRPTLDANAVVERELDLRGCSVFGGEQRDVIPWLPTLAPKLARIISPPVALEAVPAEYQRLLDGRAEFLKTIVQP